MSNHFLIVIIFVALSIGAFVEHQRLSGLHAGEIARVKAAHAQELAQYTASLLAGAQATDTAVTLWHTRVKQSEANADVLKAQLSRTLRRACLSAADVRMLNRAAGVPTSAERVAASPAAPPANPAGYASSHAVSIWAADVQRQYDACRAQVDALRAWDEGTYGP